ncbi:hypothetical protein [Mesorhizobium sp.]|uniref:hypothetical protein n=1 Tax=Mesorhizobium sp. TaxID=1871066 RepID=UPI000FE84F18|nr:hypothetical protein [Mesorhizobium sp.]RWI18302.1 MAG: hypothetical protein EOQ92_23595 [Mesorhizobium sp.]RWK47420.1 MAG: hypothetical protein EOR47_22120 [Mesorhizobium sp.]RWK91614.1 MAG: hypothetical protein EOR53_28495 [Mesorhizobium sp.]TIQ17974.1 MAG: hypothetical protein E5X51_27935 [Mesorhizobium sp.]TIQ28032.1 MAG: hypothetical protein E5X54_19365 [Mesorhizobium sp.]
MAFVMACGPLLSLSCIVAADQWSIKSLGPSKAWPRRRHFQQIPAKGLSRSSRSSPALHFASADAILFNPLMPGSNAFKILKSWVQVTLAHTVSLVRPIPIPTFRQVDVAVTIAWYRMLDAFERLILCRFRNQLDSFMIMKNS